MKRWGRLSLLSWQLAGFVACCVGFALTKTKLQLQNSISSQVVDIDVVIPWSGEPQADPSGTNRDDGILKYQLRSILKNMPWVNNIFIFADPMTAPIWFQEFDSRVQLVNRCENFIGGQENCPTFNTFAVYANIHTIRGLSERYIVCDDDVLILTALSPEYFFSNRHIHILLGEQEELYRIKYDEHGYRYVTEIVDEGRQEYPRLLPRKVPLQRRSRMHAPWPCLRSQVIQMQKEYGDWFKFISSHRLRFCFDTDALVRTEGQRGNKNGACYRENSYFAMMWYLNEMGYVKPPLPQYVLEEDTISYEDIEARNLANYLQSGAACLNINDSAMLQAKDIQAFQVNTSVQDSYKMRKEYVLGTLEHFFPVGSH